MLSREPLARLPFTPLHQKVYNKLTTVRIVLDGLTSLAYQLPILFRYHIFFWNQDETWVLYAALLEAQLACWIFF